MNMLAVRSSIGMGIVLQKLGFLLPSFRKRGFPGRVFQLGTIVILTIISAHSTAFGQANCKVMQSTFDADMQLMKQRSPTHLRLMASRYVELRRAARALSCSGITLVAFDGLRYRPAEWSDDPGLYFLVPQMARIFGVGLATATDVFLTAVVLLTSVFGLLGFLRTAHTDLGERIGVVAFLLLTLVELIAGDVYIMNAAPAIACVPWVLYFVSHRKLTLGMLLAFGVTGVLGGTANLFRAQAGVGLVLFSLVVAVGVYQVNPAARILLMTLVLLNTAIPGLIFRELYARRNVFLEQQPGSMLESRRVHPLWHSIYIGLSYVKNSDIPAYSDEVAAAKVRESRPEAAYVSSEYEQVLKREILKLAKRRPFLILANLVVKFAVVSFFCLCAANIGLYGAMLGRKVLWLELAFWLAIAFNGLYGILVLPNPKYLIGLIAFAALYGVYSIEYAARQSNLRRRLRWIEKLVFVRSERRAVVAYS